MISLTIVFQAAIAVVCISSTLGQNVTVQLGTSKQATTAASVAYERMIAETLTKFNAALSVVKSAEALITDTGKDIGNRLTEEFFVEGILAFMATSEFIKPRNAWIFKTTVNVLTTFPAQGIGFYKDCLQKNVEASTLIKTVVDVTQQIQKIAVADTAFKLALSKCAVVNPLEYSDCVVNATRENPLPVLSDNVINTLKVLREHLKCIQDSVDKLRALGSLSIDSIRRVYPNESVFMVPKKFDILDDRQLGQVYSIPSPSSRLGRAKTTVNMTRQLVMEAWDATKIDLSKAKAYLNDTFSEFNGIIDRIAVQPEAIKCIINAKAAVASNLHMQGTALLQCVTNIQAPPTDKAVHAVELSLSERELKENLASSTLQCFKKLSNVFYPKEMECCMIEAQDDYNLFIDDVIFSAETLWRKASDFLTMFSRCKEKSAAAAKKQFIEDTSVFEKCLKINTKIVVKPPVSNPYLTLNTTSPN